jgi:hypothetical protein
MTTTEYDETGIAALFPGDGMEIPPDDERDRADALVASYNVMWNEDFPPVPRTRTVSDYGARTAEVPTNRAFMRAKLRRWWRHPTGQRLPDVPQ